MCKTSLIVVRGKDGKVRAFHNICTHAEINSCGTPREHVARLRVSFMAGPTTLMAH